ncbi:MAG TPA: dihydrolipoamide acetyltransferase family protein [Myxococcales bacterium]|nr:dihydrolipoamide acetyltransferase family protein [Myxococcales bacterium]
MAEFLMPSLGADMEAGTLVAWMVKPGQEVKRGDIVCVVETQKGAIEVEIFESGTITELLVQPGTEVPVGKPLALLRREGETLAAAAPPSPPAPAPEVAAKVEAKVLPPAVAEGHGPRASPAARNAARALGIDLAAVTGTGLGGAITREDVEHAAAARPPAPAVPAAPQRAIGMRQAIAAAMGRSKREIPHYYLSTRSDLGRAMEWLRAENGRRAVADRLLPVALLLKAVALAARRFPEMNGFYLDGTFRPSAEVHLGVAISLKDGLVAPALHSVPDKSLGDLMRELSDLIQRARRGGLRSSELADSTLTVTSLGDNGVDSVLGIIFPPQVSLVGLGRIAERPCVRDGKVVARPTVDLSLSADHRVSDGLRGSLFLAAIDRLLQEPEAL